MKKDLSHNDKYLTLPIQPSSLPQHNYLSRFLGEKEMTRKHWQGNGENSNNTHITKATFANHSIQPNNQAMRLDLIFSKIPQRTEHASLGNTGEGERKKCAYDLGICVSLLFIMLRECSESVNTKKSSATWPYNIPCLCTTIIFER